jgi:uncharacterized protein (TIGR00369 family)
LARIAQHARTSGDYNPLLDAFPYARFLGLRASLIGQTVRLHLPFKPSLIGSPVLPALHGGVAGACLESAGLLQIIHERGGPPIPKTIDFTVDYLRAARACDVYAEAEVQRLGRRVANVRMWAFQADESQPIVTGRGHFLLD